jgi:hypothetical protein
VGTQAVVDIAAEAKVDRPVAAGDGVLQVEAEEFDVGVAIEGEEAATTGEVVGREYGIESGTGRVVECGVDDA